MQPILRHTIRSLADSTAIIKAPRSSRQLFTSSPIRSSTCLQCQFHSQKRHLADDTKPKPPNSSNPSSTTTASPSTPPHDENFSLPPGQELPSTSDSRRSAAARQLSHLMDDMQNRVFHASQRINDLTGYSGIEGLKASIAKQESELDAHQATVRAARQKYKTTVAERAASQREVTTLLARKDSWTPADLERFTALYRSDHGNEAAVQEASAALAEAEQVVERAASKLSTSILRRYHEEQIWSDKIRRMSTWGTWGLMGVNVLIFLVFQFGFEPWRRGRLVKGFEEKVREALRREKEGKKGGGEGAVESGGHKEGEGDEVRLNEVVAAGMQELLEETDDTGKDHVPAYDGLAAVISNDADNADKDKSMASNKPANSSVKRLESWKLGLLELFSDRVVSLKAQDVTIIALEGVATGAALVGLSMMFIFRPT